ncbi:hypothetical protein [Pseudomonas purpurea]|uniref:hypothetical protein n=1 Tax=Pseudomonas purpurea TaxID=3136737 RepID=UPI003267AB1A
MPAMNNFVAVDWRSSKDRLYFFFKDSNRFSRFNISDNEVPAGYPTAVTNSNWKSFHEHAKNLRFGFTTTGMGIDGNSDFELDILWLFYDKDGTPFVCAYDQDNDKPISYTSVESSIWKSIAPYYDRIIAGTWREDLSDKRFSFILNDGKLLDLQWKTMHVESGQQSVRVYTGDTKTRIEPITEATWPGMTPYKNRIITAVQNDRILNDNYWYIFLTDNEYITYNLPEKRIEYGPLKINNTTWPGLLRD